MSKNNYVKIENYNQKSFKIENFLPTYAPNVNKKTIKSTTHRNWKEINDKDVGGKHTISFHDEKGGLIKLGPNYINKNHIFNNEIAVVVIDGDVQITEAGETVIYKKGDYYTVPAKTVITSYSKNGALVALFGDTPGKSKKI